jgi:hypothetical protein
MGKKIKTKNKYCFASELEAARIIAGFPLHVVAKMCCRDVRTIKDWESGKQPCPAWAVRLITLESRYMDALYGIQRDRCTGFAEGMYRNPFSANEENYSTQLTLALVK